MTRRCVAVFIRGLTVAVLLVLVATACGGGGGGSAPAPVPPTATELFDTVWSDFDRQYSFFVLKGIDWDDSRARFRPQLDPDSSGEALFDVLSAMLLELEDGHVRLSTPFGTSVYTGWFDRHPENFDETVVTATYLSPTEMLSPAANLLFGRVDDDIGYVRVHSLGGSGHGEDMDFILDRLAGIRALIVDLRGNSGGSDANGEALVGRFADTERLYRRVRFRDGPAHDDFDPPIDDFIAPAGARSFSGPIAVLTNRRTFSSGEAMVLAFDVLPQSRSFGDYTGGGSANPVERTLPNGWRYTVSRWVVFLPDGATFEGVGIEPDVRVDITAEDAAALRDTIMDVAIDDLRSRLSVTGGWESAH